ncbi:flagellar biosynthesis/type III secretory pathway protein [bacterium D16-54]|nr:flagellar biosynthesis/type III secretory pathway protein [bacterium D16-54]RKJ13073.1 flagellar biosynthesis/type III secretory pathway protein [bacterium D16-56]
MTTSSLRRVIKQPDASGASVIEQFVPPRELIKENQLTTARAPSFPRYSKDGKEQGEYRSVIKYSGQDMLKEEEELKQKRKIQTEDFAELEDEVILPDPDKETIKRSEEDAAKLLEDARKEAEELLAEASRTAEKIREEASQAGFREGYEAGYREGRQKAEAECQEAFRTALASFQEDMRQALKSVDTAKEHCLRSYLDELKDCAVAIGEKVIHISLRSSGEVIRQMIIAATEKLKKTAWVKIYIDKCDYDMMMEADAAILDELSHLSDNIKFIVMDKEERGSCIIEMPEEIVDVSVNTQIENIKDILENVRV